jgi:hypothetical protein
MLDISSRAAPARRLLGVVGAAVMERWRILAVWKVEIVQPMVEEGVDGFGFNITDDKGRPRVRFAFETRADAEAAATHAQEVVKTAIAVHGFGLQ